MKVLRTPDARFAALPDYAFEPRYVAVADPEEGTRLRLHYLDEGRRDGRVILLMHGEPTWSYLYRHFVPPLVARGYRVLAPDLIGFGRSDKPARAADYSYARHVAWVRDWIEQLDITGITLACQDWGSLIGLRLLAEMEQRFAGVVLSNGGLPDGGIAPRAFALWRAFARFSPVFPIGRIVAAGTRSGLTAAERAAYDAPFPDRRYAAGARIFPQLVPFAGNAAIPDQIAAWRVLDRWEKPFACRFGDADPITRGGEAKFVGRVPGTRGLSHAPLRGGHFIQEDDPHGFVDAIVDIADRVPGNRH
jgi:haloalkane dehalogenase